MRNSWDLNPKLYSNDVPQAFVIKGEDSAIVERLRAEILGPIDGQDPIFWVVRNDTENYPEANILASSLVCIPLHEDLKLPDLDWIIKILGSIKGDTDDYKVFSLSYRPLEQLDAVLPEVQA